MLDPVSFCPIYDHVVVTAGVYDVHVDDRAALVVFPLPDDWTDVVMSVKWWQNESAVINRT